MIKLTLVSRSYCHLCDDMLDAVRPLQERYRFELEVADVDADPTLLEQYDELVPVLLGSKKDAPIERICHYFLDRARLEAFLAE